MGYSLQARKADRPSMRLSVPRSLYNMRHGSTAEFRETWHLELSTAPNRSGP